MGSRVHLFTTFTNLVPRSHSVFFPLAVGDLGTRLYFHTHHNAPSFTLRNLCFQFLLGITVVLIEIQDNGYAKFWGVNKVHYGLCENDE